MGSEKYSIGSAEGRRRRPEKRKITPRPACGRQAQSALRKRSADTQPSLKLPPTLAHPHPGVFEKEAAKD